MSKNATIQKVYNDFYGSIKQTYEEAKKIDATIKYDDIKNYFEKHRVRKTNLRGYNSFIANNFICKQGVYNIEAGPNQSG